MRDKIVVISGATSGIGRVAAAKLAAMGARIVIIARDRARGGDTLEELRAISSQAGHAVYYADLSRLSEVRRVGSEIAAAHSKVDVLINNAGAIFASRAVTEDGLERTFALNHMSYFLLAAALRSRLTAAAPSRIINTASNAHRRGHIDFSDLQSAKSFGASKVYGTSKLCNILFTRELARRLSGSGVTANSFSPGFVATRFGDRSGGLYAAGIRIAKLFAGTQERGAQTLVYLASSPEVAAISGEFYFKCKPGFLTPEAQDDAIARRLWAESEKLSAVPARAGAA